MFCYPLFFGKRLFRSTYPAGFLFGDQLLIVLRFGAAEFLTFGAGGITTGPAQRVQRIEVFGKILFCKNIALYNNG